MSDELKDSIERHLADKDFQNVIPIITKLLESEEFDDPVYLMIMRGVAKHKVGDLEGALLDYNKSIEIDPKVCGAYINRSELYLDMNNMDQFFADLDTVVKLRPIPKSYCKRADAIFSFGGDPNLFSHTKDEWLLKVLNDLENAIALDPDYAESYFMRGNVKVVQRKFEDALADYQKVMELDKENIEPFIAAALVKTYFCDDDSGALEYADKAVESQPKDMRVHLLKYTILHEGSKSKDWDRAISSINEAINLDPDNGTLYFYRGSLLVRYGDSALSSAKDDLETACRLNPDEWMARYDLCTVHMKLGNHEEALEQLNRIIEINPELASVYESRAEFKKRFLDDKKGAKKDKNLAKQATLSLDDVAGLYNSRLNYELGFGFIVI